MPTAKEIKAAGGNDVGEWGDAQMPSYSTPMRVAGEDVAFDELPAFGDPETGDQSTGDSGGKRRAPVRPG